MNKSPLQIATAIATLALLGGCVNGSLQLPPVAQAPAPEASATQKLSVSSAGGQTRTLAVVVPAGTCNAAAYVAGYREGYIYEWNVELNSKAATAPASAQGKYAAARLMAPQEQLPTGTMTIQQSMCAAQARIAGQTAAHIQAHNDLITAAL